MRSATGMKRGENGILTSIKQPGIIGTANQSELLSVLLFKSGPRPIDGKCSTSRSPSAGLNCSRS